MNELRQKPDVALLEIIFPEISALFKGNYTPTPPQEWVEERRSSF